MSKHEHEYGPSEEMNIISRLGKALSTSSDKFSSGDPELTQKQKQHIQILIRNIEI